MKNIPNSIKIVIDEIRRQGQYMGYDNKKEWNRKVDKIENYIEDLLKDLENLKNNN